MTEKDILVVGILLTLMTAFVASTGNILSRKLKNVHFAVTGVYHASLGICTSLAVILGARLTTGHQLISFHDYSVYGAIFLAWAFDFTRWVTEMVAYQSDSSGFVALLGYIVVVYGFIADEVIFDNSISGQTLAGALTIFVVTVGVTGYKLLQSRKSDL